MMKNKNPKSKVNKKALKKSIAQKQRIIKDNKFVKK